MKIGVFDSGVGGKSVANYISKTLPKAEVIYADDRANVPYGTKAPEVLLELVKPILHSLEEQGCQVIVIACNTVTTTLIDELRHEVNVPLIGVEPMVKPASELTESGIIVVCATPATLKSQRYHWLIEEYAGNLKVIEPDCSNWAYVIENDTLDLQRIRDQIQGACRMGADVIVLGCTHYHWIEDEIISVARDYGAKVIQPESYVTERLKEVLAQPG